MVFEYPKNEGENRVTPYIQGQRVAEKGRIYFNPYSMITQRRFYNEFEDGWRTKQRELNPGQVTTRTKYPQLAVLILGLILAGVFYWWNYV